MVWATKAQEAGSGYRPMLVHLMNCHAHLLALAHHLIAQQICSREDHLLWLACWQRQLLSMVCIRECRTYALRFGEFYLQFCYFRIFDLQVRFKLLDECLFISGLLLGLFHKLGKRVVHVHVISLGHLLFLSAAALWAAASACAFRRASFVAKCSSVALADSCCAVIMEAWCWSFNACSSLRKASASEVSGFLVFNASRSACATALADFSCASATFKALSSVCVFLSSAFVLVISSTSAPSAAYFIISN